MLVAYQNECEERAEDIKKIKLNLQEATTIKNRLEEEKNHILRDRVHTLAGKLHRERGLRYVGNPYRLVCNLIRGDLGPYIEWIVPENETSGAPFIRVGCNMRVQRILIRGLGLTRISPKITTYFPKN